MLIEWRCSSGSKSNSEVAMLRRTHALRRSGGVQQGFTEGRLAVVAVTDDGDGADAIRRGRRHGE